MPHTYLYPRPALTVDCVIFGFEANTLRILLIQRDLEPFAGCWALPGGFVHIDETLEQAALRELKEETGLHDVYLEQLYTFGQVDRDPRERIVSVAYYALVKQTGHVVRAATDARDVAWFPMETLPELAFDHRSIVETAHLRLKGKVSYEPIGFELLPQKFTLRQLQQLYETVLKEKLDKRNFRRKIQGMDILRELPEMEKDVAHRAARLYAFDYAKYEALKKKGLRFQL